MDRSPLASGRLFEPRRSPPRAPDPRPARGRPYRRVGTAAGAPAASLHEVHLGVEYTIRPARITDIDRLAAIGRRAMTASGSGSLGAADLLRQCVYLPHASLLVAEARRELVGGALLVLRPSVTAGGYVGTIDFMVVAPDHDADRVTDALLEELLRSASNKGCSTVEAGEPSDPADRGRLERAGFAATGATLRCQVSAAGSGARRS